MLRGRWWIILTKTELEDFLVETHIPPRPGPLSVKPRMVKPLLRLRRPGVPAVCCCPDVFPEHFQIEYRFWAMERSCRKSGLRA